MCTEVDEVERVSASATSAPPPVDQPLTVDDVVDVFIQMRLPLERLLVARTGCRHAAKDLLQDLYFRVTRIGRVFTTQAGVQGYLVRMAINAAIDHVRGETRRAQLLAMSEANFVRESPTPEEILARSDHVHMIDRVLNQLPQKCKMVLFLGQVQGMTHTEIAREMGVSRSLVEKYTVMALAQCRARFTGSKAIEECMQ